MIEFRKTNNHHADVINYFIEKHNYKSYLEIGTWYGNTFNKIVGVDVKHGIEPNPNSDCDLTHEMTSDQFFREIDQDYKYDVIYVDGLHESYQVDKDLKNSIMHLSDDGMIFLDDIWPPDISWQITPRVKKSPGWCGDVWKSYVKLRCTRSDLRMIAFQADKNKWSRISIIRHGNQETIKDPIEQCLDYEYFDQNRERLLNIVLIKEALAL